MEKTIITILIIFSAAWAQGENIYSTVYALAGDRADLTYLLPAFETWSISHFRLYKSHF